VNDQPDPPRPDALAALDWSHLPPNQRAFLAAYSRLPNIAAACVAAQVSRTQVYAWREAPEFAAAMKEANLIAGEVLEAEAWRRAVDGVARLKFHDGAAVNDPRTGAVYEERHYSDTLIQTMLAARFPEKYRTAVQHQHAGAVAHLEVDLRELGRAIMADPTTLDDALSLFRRLNPAELPEGDAVTPSGEASPPAASQSGPV